jgi:hypothetical protein
LFALSSFLTLTATSFIRTCFEFINIPSPIKLGKALWSLVKQNEFMFIVGSHDYLNSNKNKYNINDIKNYIINMMGFGR